MPAKRERSARQMLETLNVLKIWRFFKGCPILLDTLQGINISHLGKRKIIFKMLFWWDMLVPWRCTCMKCLLLKSMSSAVHLRCFMNPPMIEMFLGGFSLQLLPLRNAYVKLVSCSANLEIKRWSNKSIYLNITFRRVISIYIYIFSCWKYFKLLIFR